MTARKWLRGITILGLMAALSLFLSPSIPQLVQIGPKLALAHCDDGNPAETDSNQGNACALTPAPPDLTNQVIFTRGYKACWWGGGCVGAQPKDGGDWWVFSAPPSTLLQFEVQNYGTNPGTSDFNIELFDNTNTLIASEMSVPIVSPTLAIVTPASPGFAVNYYLKVTNTYIEPIPGDCSPPFLSSCSVTIDVNLEYNLRFTSTAPPTPTPTPTMTPLPIAPDTYDVNGPNDNPFQATPITASCSPFNATISGPGDHDFYMFQANPGSIRVSALSTFGVSLNLVVTQTANNTPFVTTDNGSPNPVVNGNIVSPGFTLIEIYAANDGVDIALYSLTVCNLPPPTRTPTPTPGPTATATATPNLGNAPDVAESNNDFPASFRISPGNTLSLNFNSGFIGVPDYDYFVMTVKTDVTYTCQTSNLGTGADTIVQIFGPLGSDTNLIAANDDVNAQTGNVASKVTWKSTYDGEVFVRVSQNGGLTVPGLASYTLSCTVGTGISTGSVSSSGGGGVVSGGGSSSSSAHTIQLIATPTGQPTAVVVPIAGLTINVVVAYDANDNGVIDLAEGVSDMSIRVTNPNTNTELSHGFTDQHGSLTLIVSAEQDKDVLVVIPFLSIGKRFSMSSLAAEWHILLPASSLPGVIP